MKCFQNYYHIKALKSNYFCDSKPLKFSSKHSQSVSSFQHMLDGLHGSSYENVFG